MCVPAYVAELRQLLVSNAKNKEAVEAKCNGLQASLEEAQAHIDLLNREKLEMAAHYQVRPQSRLSPIPTPLSYITAKTLAEIRS